MGSRNETSKLWEDTLLENQQILRRLLSSSNGDIGLKEIEFRSTFPDRDRALAVRNVLKRIFHKREKIHVFIMNMDSEHTVYDCLLSVVIPVDPSTITEIELGMSTVCEEFGGSAVSWGFISNESVAH